MLRRVLILIGIEAISTLCCAMQPFWGTLFLLLLIFVRPQDDRPNMQELHFPLVTMIAVICGTVARMTVFMPRVLTALKGVSLMIVLLLNMLVSAIATSYTPMSSYQISEFLSYILFCGLLIIWVDSINRLLWTAGTLILTGLYYCQLVARNPGMLIHEQIAEQSFARLTLRNLVNFGNPNFQGILMVIMIMVALSIAAEGPKIWLRLGMLCTVPAFLFVFLKCQSRGATIGLIAAFGVFWLLQKRKMLIGVTALIIIVIGLVFFAPATYFQRLTTVLNYQADSSATGRLELGNIALSLIVTHPLTGVGPGNFELHAPNSQHNAYLQAASELGLEGCLFYAMVLGAGLLNAIKARSLASPRNKNIPIVFSLAGGIAAAIVAIIVQGFFTGFAFREFVYTTLTLAFVVKRIAAQYEPSVQAPTPAPAPLVAVPFARRSAARTVSARLLKIPQIAWRSYAYSLLYW